MKQMSEEDIRRIRERQYQNKLRSYKRHLINQSAKREEAFRANNNLKLIEVSNRIGSLRNCLRWGLNESKPHILKKLELCMELMEMEHEFITEAKFVTGARCDILDLTDGTIYEVLHTESEAKFEENKAQKYPKDFKIVKVKA